MMSNTQQHLSTLDMARFAARGFIALPGVVPAAINAQFLADVGAGAAQPATIRQQYAEIMRNSHVPLVRPGTPLHDAYPAQSALQNLLQVPAVAGAIDSLVGLDCVIDHHFLHITFPPHMYPDDAPALTSQPTHQDSTIDPRQAFDVQLFYFPHAVDPAMGGTRFIPGSQFRVVSESAVARYQNVRGQEHVVCPAGTVIFFHMGLWHGGGLNQSDTPRYMFKIRMCPTKRQLRLWQPANRGPQGAPEDHTDKLMPRPIFWTNGQADPDHLHEILTTPEKWYEMDTGRLEFLQRVRFWRYLTGDKNFDADYWLTRVENEYTF